MFNVDIKRLSPCFKDEQKPNGHCLKIGAERRKHHKAARESPKQIHP